MVDSKRLRAFRKRWNIQLDDQKELERFKNRVLAQLGALVRTDQGYPLKAVDDHFSFLIGKQSRDTFSDWVMLAESEFGATRICESIAKATNLIQVIEAIQFLFWALEDVDPDHLDAVITAIRGAIEYSPAINLRLMRRGDRVTLYKAGVKILDEAVVNDTLTWLEDYPKVATHFEESLRIYLLKDKSKYRNLLDNLRFAVEQLLRSILHNRKSLEKQKGDLFRWLKEYGAHQQIINMYQTLLTQFALYQNEAVKHGEAFSPSELEFIIYLTSTFMWFLLKLNNKAVSE